jgi:hypothetical protein
LFVFAYIHQYGRLRKISKRKEESGVALFSVSDKADEEHKEILEWIEI